MAQVRVANMHASYTCNDVKWGIPAVPVRVRVRIANMHLTCDKGGIPTVIIAFQSVTDIHTLHDETVQQN